MPDQVVILSDRAIGRESAGAGGIHYRHAQPLVAIGIILRRFFLRKVIRGQILQNEIRIRHAAAIAEQQRVINFLEHPRILRRKRSVDQLLHHFADCGVRLVNLVRAVMDIAVLDLLGGIVRRRPLTGEEAMAQLIRLEEDARRGNPAAQTEFARRLLTDAPDSRKNRRALSLLRKTAARKLPEALHLLGVVMLRGQGLDADPAEGAKLLEEAAYLGSAGAAADLARLCRMGLGRPASDRDALYWYRIAGAKGHTASQREAGLMLRDGRGARADNDEAARWLRAAAQGRDPQAQYELARLHQRRGWAGADPEEAARWLTEAALSGVVEAQYRLGVHYWAGRGGRVDLREAVRWTCRAAENGSTQALTTLADFFLTGSALDMNRFNAYTLLKCAARLHDAGAATTLTALERMLTRSEKARATRLVMISKTPRVLVETLIPRQSR